MLIITVCRYTVVGRVCIRRGLGITMHVIGYAAKFKSSTNGMLVNVLVYSEDSDELVMEGEA